MARFHFIKGYGGDDQYEQSAIVHNRSVRRPFNKEKQEREQQEYPLLLVFSGKPVISLVQDGPPEEQV